MALVMAVRAPLSGGLGQGLPFSVQVPALVAKSRGLSPLIRDTQTAGTGNVDPQWTGTSGLAYPNDFTGAQAFQNMMIQAPSYDPFSSGIGVPNPFVGGKYSAINNQTGGLSNEFEQYLHWKFNLPSTIQTGDTCCIYMRWRERNEPTANLGVSAAHGSGYNNKIWAYGPGGYSQTFSGNSPPQSWLTALPNSGNVANLASIVWSSANGGTATATTSSNIPDQATNLTFSSLVQGAVPAGYNVGSSSQLAPNFTITGPNTFTYALATNPGTCTTPGQYLTPAWTNLTTDCQLHNGDNTNGTPAIIELPDRNGMNSIFWGHRLNSYKAANGWLQIEVELCIDTHTGSSGKGFYRYIVNGNRASSQTTGVIINYAGRTDNFMAASATQRAISFGCGMYSQAVGANSISYLSDIYCDMSAGGVSGQCARLLLGDSATYNSCGILEPQQISSMTQAAGQTTVHGPSLWKGSLVSGSTAYWYYQDESGTVYSCGSGTVI